jgi:Fe-S-cluster-containing dehydrogenase component
MTRYGMVININKCSGCYNCVLACKDEHCGHDYPGYTAAQPMTGHFWMQLIERERGKYPKVKLNYIPITCMHCQNPSCVKAAENGAVYRRPDGIVIIDPAKAHGQKQLVSSCPYRVIYWNESLNIAQKCTFCAHLLDQGWKEPRCVELCPTDALVFGDLDDPESEAAKLVASNSTEILHPEYGLKENVSYVSVPRKFIAGTVIYGDIDECALNASVIITNKNDKRTAVTNCFGDFEIEGLADNEEYKIEINAPKYQTREYHVKTQTDIYLGIVKLIK